MNATEDTPFWLVWNPAGRPPMHRHATVGQAEAEAERLARDNPGQSFFVLQPIALVVRNDVQKTRFICEISF